jgi:hypothetical protein
MTAQEEFSLMQNSKKGPIRIQVPGGPLIEANNSWDYKTNLTETSVKTTADIKVDHPLVEVKQLDMSPYTATKAFKITILRQPKSNLTYPEKRNKNLL